MIEVDDNSIDLLKADWDVLLILDACRYDFFERIYKDIIQQECTLKKARTFCSGTFDWMENNFRNKDCSNVIYINCIVMFDKFMPNDTFFKVVKVWQSGWDYEYGTITPQNMTDEAMFQTKLHPRKRIIVHYHQPHPPYLLSEYKNIDKILTPKQIQLNVKENGFGFLYQGKMRKWFGYERAWRWLIKLGIEPLDYYGKIYKKFGKEGLIRGYTENLKIVLRDVVELLEFIHIFQLNKKVVITSDHSHNLNGDIRNLNEQFVPWLEIK